MICFRASADHASVSRPPTASTTATTTSTWEFAAQRAIGGEGLQDRPRICEARWFSINIRRELRQRGRGARASATRLAQRVLQIGAGVAAQAAIAEQRDIVGRAAHERIVDADAAELVDDDRGARTLGGVARKSGAPAVVLPAAEEAGDHGHRNARRRARRA